MHELEIISVVDNYVVHPRHSSRGLLGEHGLSFYISAYGQQILFDTGQGLTIQHNFNVLSLDWSGVDSVILSHGHRDHTGGLEDVLQKTEKVKVYVHPDIFNPKYTAEKGEEPRLKKIAVNKKECESMGAQFILREKKMRIEENLYLLGPVNRIKPSDDLYMPSRYIKEGSIFQPDPLTDEQVLAINTPEGLILILGCTHNGLENTVEQVQEIMEQERIYGIVGGLHLCDTGLQKLEELALWLKVLDLRVLVCGHCTGFEAVKVLQKYLGEKVVFNYVGNKTTVIM